MDDHHHLINLTGNDLTIENVINIAENGYKVDFPEEVKEKIKRARKLLDHILLKYPEIKIYGANRLHGDLKKVNVVGKKIKYQGEDRDILEVYQEKYINVHNCGTGKPLSIEEVRAIMVIRLNSFAKGDSAMTWETVEFLIKLLNKGVTPVVLEEGSVGASGDLIPLAMVAATMIALPKAEAFYGNERMSAKQALEKAGLKPVILKAKEAMGLTNGSNFIAALSVFAIRDTENLLKNVSISASLSLEAIRGEKDAFSETINDKNRKHIGQVKIAGHIRKLIEKSNRMSLKAQIAPFTRDEPWDVRVQDRYSFRAIPQVHGVTYEALQKLKETIYIEINSATDNPLFEEIPIKDFKKYVTDSTYQKLLNDEKLPNRNGEKFILKAYSGANFHGQSLATVIDYLKIAITSLALITDKRTYSLLDDSQSYGLPADLAVDTSNADGGLMIAQYAGAARVAECRVLSTPASVTSVATSANQEDFVSMGSIGALHLKKIIYNTQLVTAIEMLCAMRGIEMTQKDLSSDLRKLGTGTQKVYDFLIMEKRFDEYKSDMYLKVEMDKMFEFVKNNDILNVVSELLD